jgi:hypothetical protein
LARVLFGFTSIFRVRFPSLFFGETGFFRGQARASKRKEK